jgi:hypothetical protein
MQEPAMSVGQIAIIIDGGYSLKRIRKELPPEHTSTLEKIAKTVGPLCFNHIARITGNRGRFWQQSLYRTFFYVAEPHTGVAHHPIANRQIEFAKSALPLDMGHPQNHPKSAQSKPASQTAQAR